MEDTVKEPDELIIQRIAFYENNRRRGDRDLIFAHRR